MKGELPGRWSVAALFFIFYGYIRSEIFFLLLIR